MVRIRPPTTSRPRLFGWATGIACLLLLPLCAYILILQSYTNGQVTATLLLPPQPPSDGTSAIGISPVSDDKTSPSDDKESESEESSSRISCGSHAAASCALCQPPSDQYNDNEPNTEAYFRWCNADCTYDLAQQVCVPRSGPVSCGGHTAASCAACLDGGRHPPSWCNGDCVYDHDHQLCRGVVSWVHPAHTAILGNYSGKAFQTVRTERGETVNILLVKTPMDSRAWKLFEQYQNDVVFMGISSFESFPLSSPNPYSANFSNDLYRHVFPGWLTMMRHPEDYFDPVRHTKYVLLSQSDFSMDGPLAFGRKYQDVLPKKYDFVYSGTDQNVLTGCKGWASFAKNWTFMLDALAVMCAPPFNLTGVLIANKDKSGRVACDIPPACHGRVVQTTFLPNQTAFYEYTVQSRFMMVPNVYDASPRVVSQSLALNVPVLMNRHIVGGWKYVNEETGEFFTDLSDFATQLRRLLTKIDRDDYHPRTYMEAHYGNVHAGPIFRDFVAEHFADRVPLPPGTQQLIPWGA